MRRWRYAFSGEVYQDKRGNWRWRVKARNGLTVGDSSEGYVNKSHCVRMCRRVCRVRKVEIVA